MNRQRNRRKQNTYTRQTNNGERHGDIYEPIAGGVFARLKTEPLEEVAEIEVPKFWPRVTVPVTFSGLPRYIERIWETMPTSIVRRLTDIDADYGKAVFIKGALMLAEAKVCTRYCSARHREYSLEEFRQLKCMSRHLPYPLVLYLKCLGKTNDCAQEVTPILAQHADNATLSAALSWAPKQLPPLLQLLREGISVDSAEYAARDWLRGLPKIEWEEYPGAKLTEQSFNFWTRNVGTAEEPRYDLNWTDEDQDMFQKIIHAMSFNTNSIVPFDLFEDTGSRAQFVRTSGWDVNGSSDWFVNTNVDDYSIKLGVAFGFGSNAQVVSESRFTGENAHMRVLRLSPQDIINPILYNWHSRRYTSQEINGQMRLETVSRVQISKLPSRVTVVPVTLSALPRYTDCMWEYASGARGFRLDSDSKAVFSKGALMLAQAKLYYAQRDSGLPPDENLASLHSYEELENLNRLCLCYKLPLPLALYLECLGNTYDGSQQVTPILAESPHEWTNEGELDQFQRIIQSFGFATPGVYVDLSHGNGSPAQFVQTPKWESDWFVNTTNNVDDYSIKLGVAFGFGSATQNVKSRFTGSFDTAYMTGYQYPWHIITKIVTEWSKNIDYYDSDSS